jgi:quinol monooxygenase YgiN
MRSLSMLRLAARAPRRSGPVTSTLGSTRCQARVALLLPPRHEGTLAARLALGHATRPRLPRVSSTRPAFRNRRAAIRPPTAAARRAHSLPPSARLANAVGRCLTCRSTGASTAWHLGREALVVHVAPRGPGATPFRPGYLYVRRREPHFLQMRAMAESKTKATEASVHDYIASRASEEQRSDCDALMSLLGKVTGEQSKMWGPSIVGYGAYEYKYESGRTGQSCMTGLTGRSTGAPTAGHLAREALVVHILRLAGKAPCRRRPVNSALGTAMPSSGGTSLLQTRKPSIAGTGGHALPSAGTTKGFVHQPQSQSAALRGILQIVTRTSEGSPHASQRPHPDVISEVRWVVSLTVAPPTNTLYRSGHGRAGGAGQQSSEVINPSFAEARLRSEEYRRRSTTKSVCHSAQRCLTCRSTGAPTAGHQARSAGTRYIVCGPGLAPSRRRPVNSALGVHPAPRGPGTTPSSPGYLYVRPHSEAQSAACKPQVRMQASVLCQARKGNSTMIIILANVQVAPNRMQEALAISKQHVARSRTEPGCISHSVYEDKDKENHLVFVEEWESDEALQRHFAVPETGQFANALGAMAAVRPKNPPLQGNRTAISWQERGLTCRSTGASTAWA